MAATRRNPEAIAGAEDPGRDNLVQSHSNPLTEGIFKYYGSQMTKYLGLYEKVACGVECKGCWAVEGKKWFRHHRETPQRIELGEADVGIVWVTEVVHAKNEGRTIEAVEIPAPLNQQDKVEHVIGTLNDVVNPENAQRYLSCLATPEAQAIHAKYGFIPATADELMPKPIPGS